ncbi:MAG TPA: hypothetical protein VMH84_11330 [Xanthobacteraceae bacterium]|nr:hypothetical protein [Xanthobacteraceae bacterium]
MLKVGTCGVFLAAFAAPSPTNAGAWTQPEGGGQAIVTATTSSAVRAFDRSGMSNVPTYNKYELQGLFEYGITSRFTFIFSPSLQHVDIGAPTNSSRTGLGYTEVGGRYKLWENESWVVSGQATVRVPGTSDNANPAAVGYTGYEYDVRGLLGRGFTLGSMPAFFDLELAQRFRDNGYPSEFRTDFTFGIRPLPRWLVLTQFFNVFSEGTGGPLSPTSYEYYKFQLSGVYSITTSLALQAGAFTTYAGRNALQENGGIIGLWYKF